MNFLLVLLFGGAAVAAQKWAAKKAGVPWDRYLRMTPEERRKAGVKI